MNVCTEEEILNCWQSLGKWRESFCRTVADTRPPSRRR